MSKARKIEVPRDKLERSVDITSLGMNDYNIRTYASAIWDRDHIWRDLAHFIHEIETT